MMVEWSLVHQKSADGAHDGRSLYRTIEYLPIVSDIHITSDKRNHNHRHDGLACVAGGARAVHGGERGASQTARSLCSLPT